MKRVVAAVLFCLSGSAFAQDATKSWDFDVLLDDQPIGSHRFDLTSEGSGAVLESVASFDVKLWFVRVFSYRHHNTETWRDGCLVGIDATTDNNGELLQVNGEITNNGFAVTNQQGQAELDGCVKTFAYWNPAILESTRLLNAQTGEYEPVDVSLDGEEDVRIGDRSIATERFRLSAKSGEIILWYTKGDSRWVGLSAPTKSDRRLRYLARSSPESGLPETLAASVSDGRAYEKLDNRAGAD